MQRCANRVCIRLLCVIAVYYYLLGFFFLYKSVCLDESERINNGCQARMFEELDLSTSPEVPEPTTESFQLRWLKKRQELISSGGLRKVYLLAYMRGGSTLLGEAFNQDRRAWYWYEPLNLFYAAHYALPKPRHPYATLMYNQTHYRDMPLVESIKIAEHVNTQLSCQFEDLPIESLASDMLLKSSMHFRAYTGCLQSQVKNKDLLKNKAQWKVACTDMVKLGASYCTNNAKENKQLSDVIVAYREDCPQFVEVFKKLGNNGSNDFTNTSRVLTLLRAHGINITDAMYKSNSYVKRKIKSFQDLTKCQQALKPVIQNCMQKTKIQKTCLTKNLTVTKNLRLKMKNIVPTLERIPDLYVIHYLRDPRAIARSQVDLDKCTPLDSCFIKITKRLCSEMLEDFTHRQKLAQEFPGVFLQIRYEDFLTNVTATVDKMYGHIQLKSPDIKRWFNANVHAKKSGNNFSLMRANGESRIHAWRKGLQQKTIADISNSTICSNLLKELGYQL